MTKEQRLNYLKTSYRNIVATKYLHKTHSFVTTLCGTLLYSKKNVVKTVTSWNNVTCKDCMRLKEKYNL